MIKIVVLIMFCFNLYANDCFKYFVYNDKPHLFLRNNNRFIPGEFKKNDNETTDGFYYYKGYTRVDDKGHVIGKILYKYYPSDRILFISHMVVEKKDRKIGTALLARVLQDYPETLTIRSNLGLSNFEVFKKAKNSGNSNIKALKQTMAYKMRRRLGFSNIVKISIDVEMENHSVVFAVNRFRHQQ